MEIHGRAIKHTTMVEEKPFKPNLCLLIYLFYLTKHIMLGNGRPTGQLR